MGNFSLIQSSHDDEKKMIIKKLEEIDG